MFGMTCLVALGFRNQKIRKPRVRIESDHPHGVRNEIRKRVHVVIELPLRSLVENIFDPVADIDPIIAEYEGVLDSLADKLYAQGAISDRKSVV